MFPDGLRSRDAHVSFLDDDVCHQIMPEEEENGRASSLPAIYFNPLKDDSTGRDLEEDQGGENISIPAEILDQLNDKQRSTLNGILEEREQRLRENGRIDQIVSYPMLSSAGLMGGGFPMGCVSPIFSPMLDWRDLGFVAQDVILLALYGLVVSISLITYHSDVFICRATLS